MINLSENKPYHEAPRSTGKPNE